MFVLGLSGDVGAGKSTVASFLKSIGAKVVDADKIVRDLWAEGELAQKALSRYGSSILGDDGRVSLPKISDKIFCEKNEYDWICGMIHPEVRRIMTSYVGSCKGFVVAEIPLMFESGVPYWCDMTAYVTASLQKRIERNGRRNFSKAEISRREAFLMESAEKRSKADLVIENDGTLDDLAEFMKPLGEKMLRMASICTMRIQCPFRSQAKKLISAVLTKKLAYQANLMAFETAYARYDQFLMRNWEIEFYTLRSLVPSISQEASEILKLSIFPLSVFDVEKVSLSFRESLCGACL